MVNVQFELLWRKKEIGGMSKSTCAREGCHTHSFGDTDYCWKHQDEPPSELGMSLDEKLNDKAEEWRNETSPVKGFAILSLLILLFVAITFLYVSERGIGGLVGGLVEQAIIVFFIFIPLTWLWNKIKSN